MKITAPFSPLPSKYLKQNNRVQKKYFEIEKLDLSPALQWLCAFGQVSHSSMVVCSWTSESPCSLNSVKGTKDNLTYLTGLL